jgi:Glycosyl transferase family 2
MMQKDESFLLRPWLAYHGYLFGFENLYVLDNGSTLPEVTNALHEYARKGVRVIWDFATRQHYEAKGDIVGEVIRLLDAKREYDFLIPLDCDEFIVLRKENEVECSREAILGYLASLDGGSWVFRFPYQLANRPLHVDLYHRFDFFKVFFGAGAFSPMDHGHHIAKHRPDTDIKNTRLLHLHFHYKNFDQKVKEARQSWVGSVDTASIRELHAYGGPSAHLTRYFLQDEEEYYRSFRNKVHFYLPRFRSLLHDLGDPLDLPSRDGLMTQHPRITGSDDLLDADDNGGLVFVPNSEHVNAGISTTPENFRMVRFNERLYLAANPDLVIAGVDPTAHFFEHGFKEGRPLRPS